MEITDLTREHVADVAELTAAAYADDPIFRNVFTAPRRQRAYHVTSTWLALSVQVPGRTVRVALLDGAAAGVAIWRTRESDAPDPEPTNFASRWRRRRFWRRIRPDRRRYARFAIALPAAMPQEPGWFLGQLAVHPDHQREGIGRALLHDGLARADAEHQPVLLQASTLENIAFYERSGFTVVTRHELFPGCPPLWNMRRGAVAPLQP